MRTSEARIEELHRRMDALKKERIRRRYMLQCSAAGIACLAIVIVMAFVIAGTAVQSSGAGPGGFSASIFADHATLRYVIVALLAFCLGVLVVIFCFRLRKHMEEKDDARKP